MLRHAPARRQTADFLIWIRSGHRAPLPVRGGQVPARRFRHGGSARLSCACSVNKVNRDDQWVRGQASILALARSRPCWRPYAIPSAIARTAFSSGDPARSPNDQERSSTRAYFRSASVTSSCSIGMEHHIRFRGCHYAPSGQPFNLEIASTHAWKRSGHPCVTAIPSTTRRPPGPMTTGRR
jgi:hypothetical protein